MKTEAQKAKRKIYMKEYDRKRRATTKYKESFNIYQRIYYKKCKLENPEFMENRAANQRKLRLRPINSKKHKSYTKQYRKTLKGKEVGKRHLAKRQRELRYNPLNPLFKNCNGHHIDSINVINIPETLHKTISHRQSNEKQMKQINILAWNYMEANSY